MDCIICGGEVHDEDGLLYHSRIEDGSHMPTISNPALPPFATIGEQRMIFADLYPVYDEQGNLIAAFDRRADAERYIETL